MTSKHNVSVSQASSVVSVSKCQNVCRSFALTVKSQSQSTGYNAWRSFNDSLQSYLVVIISVKTRSLQLHHAMLPVQRTWLTSSQSPRSPVRRPTCCVSHTSKNVFLLFYFIFYLQHVLTFLRFFIFTFLYLKNFEKMACTYYNTRN